MARQRIVLAAYQCGPGLGSVSQIGWEWYSRLAHEHDVTLVTHVRNREALAAAEPPPSGSRIVYIDTEWFAGPLYRLARRLFPFSEHSVFMLSSLDYFLFDFLAWRTLAAQMRAGEHWSLVHRVTPITLAAPSWLGRLGLPVVLGPLNCGLGTPEGFASVLKKDAVWLTRLRGVGQAAAALSGATRHAARILTATKATLAAVPLRHRARCRMMIENGVDLDRFRARPWPQPASSTEPLRVLFVGRLVPFKGVGMLLEAASHVARGGQPVEVTIVGCGPMEQAWRDQAAALGLGQRVRFAGALPAEQVAAEMARCHVLCLPSVRESGGAVLLEAMACARPVIAVGFGGPAEIVDDEVGRLLAPVNAGQVTTDLAVALADVCGDPDGWRGRGRAGRRRAEDLFSWPVKVAGAKRLYQELVPAEVDHA
jgi:glycosyltransferase involved in cell wall biosynthesis